MSSSKRIVTDKTFNCQRAEKAVRFTVTEVALHLSSPGIPAAIAHAPKCSGYPACGVFPVGFPQELGSVSLVAQTGCPFFDSRSDGDV